VFQSLVDEGAARGVRHVAYSRPGYGSSTRHPGRTLASCVDDVIAVADTLGYERFHTIGTSGGAPHSIACAALLPERVIAAAAIASPAPLAAPGLDWTAGMGPENIAEIGAVQGTDEELLSYLEDQATQMRSASIEKILSVLNGILADVDRRAISGAYAEYTASQFAKALSGGIWGWFDDDRALFGEWGFDLHDVKTPLTIWHGVEDRFVPVAHGKWLAEQLGAKAELRPENGHLSLAISSYGQILDGLLGLASLRR
jgi:pimeloyl-ACP methyl ester carboxylesterase